MSDADIDVDETNLDDTSFGGPSTSIIQAAQAELSDFGRLPSDSSLQSSSPVKSLFTPRVSPIKKAIERLQRAFSPLPPTPVGKSKSLAPPATVPAKRSAKDIVLDAGPLSDPAFGGPVAPLAGNTGDWDADEDMTVEDLGDPIDEDVEEQNDSELAIGATIDDTVRSIGRTYGGDFEYGDSSIMTEF
jgi:hypothetical protein